MVPATNVSDFPQDTLNRLEETLARCKWVVPVLPHQELQTLLRSSISHRKSSKDKDESCDKFIHNCLPLCFSRLMNDEAVKEWKNDVQKHILDCAALFVELSSLYIENGELADVTFLLDILGLIFNPKNRFHLHNCQRRYGSFEKSRIEIATSSNNDDENSVLTSSPSSSEDEVVFALPHYFGPPKDWLVFLLNHFGRCGGFQKLSQRIEQCDNSQLSCSLIYSVLRPFAQCYLLLTEEAIKLYFVKILERFGKYMQNVNDDEIKKETKTPTVSSSSNVEPFKDSNSTLIDVAKFLRNLTVRMPGHENIIRDLERLRLKMILRTLVLAPFSAKMNCLNEMNRLLCSSNNYCRSPIYSVNNSMTNTLNLNGNNNNNNNALSPPNSFSTSSSLVDPSQLLLTTQEILNWMRENQFISAAIRENLHIAQYVEKLEPILRFLIKENFLTDENLDQIWASAQFGSKHEAIIKNVHELLAKLAWDFNAHQLDHLFSRFEASWHTACDKKQREKLLELIRRLAEDDKDGKLADKVLNLLWTLARDKNVSVDVTEQALQCHAKILDGSCYTYTAHQRNVLKRFWLEKCIEAMDVARFASRPPSQAGIAETTQQMVDDKEEDNYWIIPAMKHFRNICKQFPEQMNSTFQSDSQVYRHNLINCLQNDFKLVNCVTNSLADYVAKRRSKYPKSKHSETEFSLEERQKHIEHVTCRLSFIKFILHHGRLWLMGEHAEKLWHCLIVEPFMAEQDRQLGFRWFAKILQGLCDLEPSVCEPFFTSKVLTLDPSLLSEAGMHCFELFYKIVNSNAKRLTSPTVSPQKNSTTYICNFDTIGQEYVWRLVMQGNEQVAERAIELIHEIYGNPHPSLYSQLSTFHSDFIKECLSHLQASYETLCLLADNKKHSIIVNESSINPPDIDVAQQIKQLLVRSSRVVRILYGYVRQYDERPPGADENFLNASSNSGSIRYENTSLEPQPMNRSSIGRAINVGVSIIMATPSFSKQLSNADRSLLSNGSDSLPDQSEFLTHTNEMLGSFRHCIARNLKVLERESPAFTKNHCRRKSADQGAVDRTHFLELYYQNEFLDPTKDDRRTLAELDIDSGDILQAKIIQCKSPRRAASDSSPDDSSNGEASPSEDSNVITVTGDSDTSQQTTLTPDTPVASPDKQDITRCLPGEILSRQKDFTPFLLRLADLASMIGFSHSFRQHFDASSSKKYVEVSMTAATLADSCRLLLRAVPCCVDSIDRLNQITTQACDAPFGNISPLQNFYFVQSPHETLYNLELTYCQLAPARPFDDQWSSLSLERQKAAQVSFYKADGVRVCLSMLVQNNFLQQTEDSNLKSAAFYWLLQILRLLLSVTGYLIIDEATRLKLSDSACRKLSPSPSTIFLHSILAPSQCDAMRHRISKLWAESLRIFFRTESKLIEMCHVTKLLRIAWVSATSDFSLLLASDEKIRDKCSEIRECDVNDDTQELCRIALENMVICLALNPDLVEPFTKERSLQQCILDLLFSPCEIIRSTTVDALVLLATKYCKLSARLLHYFLTMFFAAIGVKTVRYPAACREFFNGLRNLLSFSSSIGFEIPNLFNYLRLEIDWLKSVRQQCLQTGESYPEDLLLEGHLTITKELVSFLDPSSKYDVGSAKEGSCLVKELLEDFLLPSSKIYLEQSRRNKFALLSKSTTVNENLYNKKSESETMPRSATLCASNVQSAVRCSAVCGSPNSTTAAFELIVVLCTNCALNFQVVVNILTEMYYNCNDTSSIIEWDYLPSVNLRNNNPFIGLKNGGATCYMNSVLQQLFTIEPLREAILSIDHDLTKVVPDAKCSSDDDDNATLQPYLPLEIGPHLPSEYGSKTSTSINGKASPLSSSPPSVSDDESRRNYHLGIFHCVQNIFAHLVGSQLQYYVPRSFWRHFRFIQTEGINLREQHDALEFFNKLVDSLDEAAKFLGKGEICSQIFGGTYADQKICKGCPHRYTREEPFNTLSLDVRHHNNLLDSLQEYVKGDLLESENAYFCEKCNKKVDAVKRLCIKKLPRILAIQLKRFDFDWEREVAIKFHDYFQFPRQVDMEPYTADGLARLEGHLSETSEDKVNTMYELRGIVIHSGQANGGHYYSCILHSHPDGTKKWYKFDDGEVSECRLDDDEEMKNQCFGGEYSSETYDAYCRRMQKRLVKRWWNAYILFYEKLEEVENVDATIMNSVNSSDINPKQFRRMSSRLETNVKRKNTKSMHERNQYTPEYFQFMRNLCSANPLILKRVDTRVSPAGDHLLLLSVQMAVKFLLTTGFRAKHTLHCNTLQEWATDVFEPAFRLCPAARHWFAQDVLYRIPARFVEFLLEAPHPDIRLTFGRILMFLAQYSIEDLASEITTIPSRYLSSPDESLSDFLLKTLIEQLRKDNNLYVHNNVMYSVNDSRFRHLREYLINIYFYTGLGATFKSQLTRLDLPVLLLKLTSDLTNVVENQRGGSSINNSGCCNNEAQKLLNILTALLRVFNLSPIARNQICKREIASDNEDDVKLECSSSPGDVTMERKTTTPPPSSNVVNRCSSSLEVSPAAADDDDRSSSPAAPNNEGGVAASSPPSTPNAHRTAVRAILTNQSNDQEQEDVENDPNSPLVQRFRRLSID